MTEKRFDSSRHLLEELEDGWATPRAPVVKANPATTPKPVAPPTSDRKVRNVDPPRIGLVPTPPAPTPPAPKALTPKPLAPRAPAPVAKPQGPIAKPAPKPVVAAPPRDADLDALDEGWLDEEDEDEDDDEPLPDERL